MGVYEKISDKATKGLLKPIEEAQDKAVERMDVSIRELQATFERIISNQNDQTLALISIYKVLELLASKDGIGLPVPLVKMEVEGEVDI